MPRRPGSRGPLDRLVQSSEFERALRSRSRATTIHFAVHHVQRQPPEAPSEIELPTHRELSTDPLITSEHPVDDCFQVAANAPWRQLGAVVPKRHARRSVTRSLLKRQIYGVAERHRDHMAEGVWVVRLRAPFDRKLFPSAASDALKATARSELEALFGAATTPDSRA